MIRYDYWFVKNFFTKNEIKILNKSIIKNKEKNLEDTPAENVFKTSEISICKYFSVKNLFHNFRSYIELINNNYFGYSIFNEHDQDKVFLNIYNSKNKSKYDYHIDGSPIDSIFDMKLTCLINTSENKYEGGQFYINRSFENYIKEFDTPGSILIFPSLYLHKVNPVTKGIRMTISYWVHGPKWR